MKMHSVHCTQIKGERKQRLTMYTGAGGGGGRAWIGSYGGQLGWRYISGYSTHTTHAHKRTHRHARRDTHKIQNIGWVKYHIKSDGKVKDVTY